jgi:hypothetical protein
MEDEIDLGDLKIAIVGQAGIDEGEREELLRYLQAELDELPFVARVEPSTTAGARVPAGAKSAEVVTVGVLALAILPKAVPQLIAFLRDWLVRPNARPVKIRVKAGDELVKAEYDPRTITAEEIGTLITRVKRRSVVRKK